MRLLYILSSGVSDPTSASLPLHLAVNGSSEIGDQPEILLAGDGTEFVAGTAIDDAQGVGVPSMRELFDKVLALKIPVHV